MSESVKVLVMGGKVAHYALLPVLRFSNKESVHSYCGQDFQPRDLGSTHNWRVCVKCLGMVERYG